MQDDQVISLEVPAELAGKRVDQALSALLPDYSRARLQKWIKSGAVTLNDQVVKPKDPVTVGDRVSVRIELEAETTWQAQAQPLEIVFEDDDIIVINKPAGLVVHPAAGHQDGTLVNALLHHAPDLEQIPRAGIVHRLDKDTSGLLVVARTLQSHHHLVNQLQTRSVTREYEAVLQGVMISGGTVNAPIARHPVDRQRMAVVVGGKEAISHYRVTERFTAHTWVTVKLATGRTHQIRVHMAHIKYPLVGDPVYGGRVRFPKESSAELRAVLSGFSRQALHARHLALVHPKSGEVCSWEVPLPSDMQQLLTALRRNEQ